MKKKAFFLTVLVQAGLFAIACFFQFLMLFMPLLTIGVLIAGFVHRSQPEDEDDYGRQIGNGMILGALFWILIEATIIFFLVKSGG